MLRQTLLLPLVALAGVVDGGAWDGPLPSISALIGLALMVGGAVLLGRGLLDLGRNFTPVPRPRDDAQLVETGVYALVRHPIYGGIIVSAFGWGAVAASPLTLLLAGTVAVFFDLKSRREEAWLATRYAGYLTYTSRTHRFTLDLLNGGGSAGTKKPGGEVGRRGPTLPPGIEAASPVPPPIREGEGFLTSGAVQWNGIALGYLQGICASSASPPTTSWYGPAPYGGTSAGVEWWVRGRWSGCAVATSRESRVRP